MKRNIIIVALIVILSVLLKFSWDSISQFIFSKRSANKIAPSVQVENVGEKEIIREFEAPGRVVSKYQVSVLARISGYLQNSYFKEGDYVTKGQVLFQIEPTEYLNNVNVKAANVENIRAQLEYAEKQLARASELVKHDYIAKARYDEILAQRDALRAQLASNQASYSDSQRNYGYTKIKSPVDGRIGIITVTVGNYVTPTSGPLTTIYSMDPIYVTFPLNSEDYTALINGDANNNKNRKVELFFSDGRKYELAGVQDFQDNKIDQSTGTVTLRATFKNNNNELLHGDFVNVKLYSNNKVKVPVVKMVAVQENQAGKFVYKLDENDIPQLVYIKTRGQTGEYWIVSDGLSAGDRIVTDGIQKVIPGNPVTIVSKEQMDKIRKNEPLEESEQGNK